MMQYPTNAGSLPQGVGGNLSGLAKVAEQPNEFQQLLNEVRNEAQAVNRAIESLCQRLEPVLRPETPQPDKDQAEAKVSLSPIEDHLRQLSAVNRINRRDIETIMERLVL